MRPSGPPPASKEFIENLETIELKDAGNYLYS
jgi:hypothetical protein